MRITNLSLIAGLVLTLPLGLLAEESPGPEDPAREPGTIKVGFKTTTSQELELRQGCMPLLTIPGTLELAEPSIRLRFPESRAFTVTNDGQDQEWLIKPRNKVESTIGTLAIVAGAITFVSGIIQLPYDLSLKNTGALACLGAGLGVSVTGIVLAADSPGRAWRVR